MTLRDCILEKYPTVEPYQGINSIEVSLKEKNYLVVMDENKTYYGILIPSDIISRPHKLVIDCMTKKSRIYPDDSFAEVFDKFNKTPSEALPVFNENEFLGLIEKSCAIENLKKRIDELYEDALTSNDVKTAFLHNLSHELRTPLNQIIGFMDIISELTEDQKKVEGKEYLNIVKSGCEQFLSVMNDMVELSLLKSGEPKKIS